MIAAICDPSVNMLNQSCMITRTSGTNINVFTKNGLSDDQLNDLYWICWIMNDTGMTLKDIVNKFPIEK